MPTWLIIVLVVLLILAVGGAIAARRRMAAREGHFERSLVQVNRDLAAAHAEDNGWERDTLEAAARRVYAAERGSEPKRSALMRRTAASSRDRSQPRSLAAAAARSRSTWASARSNAGRERASCRRRAMAPPTMRIARTTRTMINQRGMNEV